MPVAQDRLCPGNRVRLQIVAREVSIALEQSTKSSILNLLPVTVDGLAKEDAVQATVCLNVGPAPLCSRITRKPADKLGLEPGLQVFA